MSANAQSGKKTSKKREPDEDVQEGKGQTMGLESHVQEDAGNGLDGDYVGKGALKHPEWCYGNHYHWWLVL